MQHIRRRCKHCGKAYTYCTYGNGPEYGTQEGCSMEYCAECQNAINDALAKIPLRIVKEYALVNDAKEIERVSEIFEEEKEKYYNTAKFLNLRKMIPDWNCESVEMCYIDRTEYYKCVEYDGSVSYKVAVEYDVIEEKFTGKKYFEVDVHNGYVPVAQFRWPKFNSEVKVNPMTPPKGDLSYMESKWDIESNDNDKND
jgi:hypothetical protein